LREFCLGNISTFSTESANRDISAQSGIERDRRIADIDERVVYAETPCRRNLGGANQTGSC
jgi:hypothetical protein